MHRPADAARWPGQAKNEGGIHERARPEPAVLHRRRRRGLTGGIIAAAAAASLIEPKAAYAQAAGDSVLRTVLDRGHLIVGTGSTNAPWHFEDDAGKLTGMDIAMARILAKGLFDDETKVEFVLQDPAARIPNVISGKVDITIQFMTVSAEPGPARELHPALLHRGRGAAQQARQPAGEVGSAPGRRCGHQDLDPAERRRRE